MKIHITDSGSKRLGFAQKVAIRIILLNVVELALGIASRNTALIVAIPSGDALFAFMIGIFLLRLRRRRAKFAKKKCPPGTLFFAMAYPLDPDSGTVLRRDTGRGIIRSRLTVTRDTLILSNLSNEQLVSWSQVSEIFVTPINRWVAKFKVTTYNGDVTMFRTPYFRELIGVLSGLSGNQDR